jgi:hypothetical protein
MRLSRISIAQKKVNSPVHHTASPRQRCHSSTTRQATRRKPQSAPLAAGSSSSNAGKSLLILTSRIPSISLFVYALYLVLMKLCTLFVIVLAATDQLPAKEGQTVSLVDAQHDPKFTEILKRLADSEQAVARLTLTVTELQNMQKYGQLPQLNVPTPENNVQSVNMKSQKPCVSKKRVRSKTSGKCENLASQIKKHCLKKGEVRSKKTGECVVPAKHQLWDRIRAMHAVPTTQTQTQKAAFNMPPVLLDPPKLDGCAARTGLISDKSNASTGNVAAEEKQVALLLIGGERGFVEHQNWITAHNGVLSTLRADGWKVDTFLCTTALIGGPKTEVPALVAEALNIRFIIRATNATVEGQNERIQQCFYRVYEHEQQQGGGGYRFFLRGRPDQVWVDPMPPLSRLSPHAVSLRSRRIQYADSEQLNVFAFASPFTGCAGHVNAESDCKLLTTFNVDCPSPSLYKAKGLRRCLMVDDQWAVVPRRYAWAYFANSTVRPASSDGGVISEANDEICAGAVAAAASEGGGGGGGEAGAAEGEVGAAEGSGALAASAATRATAAASPVVDDAQDQAALERSYGQSLQTYMQVCAEYGFMAGPQWYSTGDPWNEAKLTTALVQQRVPVEVVPFPFVLDGAYGDSNLRNGIFEWLDARGRAYDQKTEKWTLLDEWDHEDNMQVMC